MILFLIVPLIIIGILLWAMPSLNGGGMHGGPLPNPPAGVDPMNPVAGRMYTDEELIFCAKCGEFIDDPEAEEGELCCYCETHIHPIDPFPKVPLMRKRP